MIPKEAHDCDFSRVKNWYLDDRSVETCNAHYIILLHWTIGTEPNCLVCDSLYAHIRSKYLRQTIVLSDFLTPEMNSLFNKRMLNIAGKLKMRQTYEGAILDVIPDVNQVIILWVQPARMNKI